MNQRQEMAKGLFPEGLLFSPETKFFEPRNERITAMQIRWLENNEPEGIPINVVGAGDGI